MGHEHNHNFAAVVLAAGKGTRMRSRLPKVLHKVAGRPLISHVLTSVGALAPARLVAVLAPGMTEVEAAAAEAFPGCSFAVQDQQKGTGHAVRCAEKALSGFHGTVLILYGDTPLISTHTLHRLIHAAESAEIVVLGMELDDPTGYGRLVVDREGFIEEIIEDRDASPEQKRIRLCNSGVMAVRGKHLFSLLAQLTTDNAAGEYYLTGIVSLADEHKLNCKVEMADASELLGVNSRGELALAETIMQQRLRFAALESGVTLIDPGTVYFQADTQVAADVTIHPHVVFGPGVTLGAGAEIRSFCHIEGARIGERAVVGPFARIRPGSDVGEGAHVGNFVEIKNTKFGKGAKANHLSYVGDATVGEGANIGAGAITCNYDGVNKHETRIEAGAFIGSNAALVAPVTVGPNAVVGAGSVITENVPSGALALARSRQENKPGRAKLRKQHD